MKKNVKDIIKHSACKYLYSASNEFWMNNEWFKDTLIKINYMFKVCTIIHYNDENNQSGVQHVIHSLHRY